jgi:hypothetical protein
MAMVRLEAVGNVMVKGLGYISRGDVFDVDEALIDERIMRNCVHADGSPITVKVNTLEDLSLAELKVKAQAMHVSFGAKTTKAQLIERINEAEEVPRNIV